MKKKTRSAPSLAGKVTVEQERHYDVKHIDLEDVSVYMEKPEKAVLTPTSFDNQVGWVPQIKTSPYGATTKVAFPPPMAANKKSRSVHLTIDSNAEKLRDITSPPPSYFASKGNSEIQSLPVIPIPPSPPTPPSLPPTPPTPPANRKTKSSFSHLAEEAPLPTPSPRSESFAAQDIVLPREPADTFTEDSGLQKLPRLMTVVTTFTPSLDDELAIKLGDTIRMVEEYRDGWCLVQRVGRLDAPKGVVPRFCLRERRGVVPAHKHSSSSLKGQSWR
ncbi:hypothetical protein BDZ94DRAFT_378270 [Collybia nuda]|uniref:SH3 domain-containing protein n=1 Tax=Collybia nuda TaxID=64659 RepID=A0A9P5YG90_9AGAR|nr:hypothetical protein BDZ94DRAFT_378270 [Collybia nuda]